MKILPLLALTAIGWTAAEWGEEQTITWTSAKELLSPFCEQAIIQDGKASFKVHAVGQRFFSSIDGKSEHLVDYGELIVLSPGSLLELQGRHTKIKALAIQRTGGPAVVLQQQTDLRSMGKGIEISRAAIGLNASGKTVDLERSGAEPGFKEAKWLQSEKEESPATPSK